MDEPIEVEVPLEFQGKPVGVEKGGMFQTAAKEIRVSCLPADIPDQIVVDVSKLERGHSIHVGEITLPTGVIPAMDLGIALATVVAPKKEEAGEAEAAEETCKIILPNVIGLFRPWLSGFLLETHGFFVPGIHERLSST